MKEARTLPALVELHGKRAQEWLADTRGVLFFEKSLTQLQAALLVASEVYFPNTNMINSNSYPKKWFPFALRIKTQSLRSAFKALHGVSTHPLSHCTPSPSLSNQHFQALLLLPASHPFNHLLSQHRLAKGRPCSCLAKPPLTDSPSILGPLCGTSQCYGFIRR